MNSATDFEVTVEVDHENRLILISFSGVLSKDSVLEMHKLVLECEGFDLNYNALNDSSNITEVDISLAEMREFIRETSGKEPGNSKRALVVGDDTGRFMYMSLFCEVSALVGVSKIKSKAFKTVEEAKLWLDVKN